MSTALLTNFVLATLAILNPIGKIPIWIQLTSDQDVGVRRRLAVWITLTVVALLGAAFVGGRYLLSALGIDLAAFRLAGGIVVLLLGISMIRGEIELGDQGDSGGSQEGDEAVRMRYRHIVVPFAMPILAGPGAISTMIIYESRAGSWLDLGAMLVVIGLVCVVLLMLLMVADRAKDLLGEVGLELATRLFGLVLTAIAVQFMVEALGEVFPRWIDATSPIQDDVAEQQAAPSGG